jgi:hypothetical protein
VEIEDIKTESLRFFGWQRGEIQHARVVSMKGFPQKNATATNEKKFENE